MRAEVFAFLLAALLCCVGLFLPAAQLDLTGRSLVAPATISMFQLARSDEQVHSFLDGYRDSTSKRLGARVLTKVAPRLRGQARSDAADVQDAMAALDTIKDEDVNTVHKITAGVVWTLLALNLLGAYLILGAHPASGRGRGRAIAAVVTSLLAAAVGVAVLLVLREVIAQAKIELGRDLFSLRAGAYVVPAAAIAAFVASIATLLAFARRPRVPRAAV